jgi:hypothetical protein
VGASCTLWNYSLELWSFALPSAQHQCEFALRFSWWHAHVGFIYGKPSDSSTTTCGPKPMSSQKKVGFLRSSWSRYSWTGWLLIFAFGRFWILFSFYLKTNGTNTHYVMLYRSHLNTVVRQISWVCMSWYLLDPSPSYHAQASWAETDPRCHHLLLSHQQLGFSAGFGLAMDQYGLAEVSIEGGGTYSFLQCSTDGKCFSCIHAWSYIIIDQYSDTSIPCHNLRTCICTEIYTDMQQIESYMDFVWVCVLVMWLK